MNDDEIEIRSVFMLIGYALGAISRLRDTFSGDSIMRRELEKLHIDLVNGVDSIFSKED